MEPRDVEERIADLLEVAEGWSVIDSLPDVGLYMVHYDEQTEETAHLRGVIVYLGDDGDRVVSWPYGYDVYAEVDKIPSSGDFTFTDQNGDAHTYNVDDVRFAVGHEGVVIRVFQHQGEIYHATYRKLDADYACWGGGPSCLEMYQEVFDALRDFQEEDFFNDEDDPSVYHLLVVHPDLLVGTRQYVAKGYLVYLTAEGQDVYRPTLSAKKRSNMMKESVLYLYEQEKLTPKEANNFLRYGYYRTKANSIYLRGDNVADGARTFSPPKDYPDERMYPGEFVVMFVDDESPVRRMFRLQSPGYTWRLEMRGGHPNFQLQFYKLLNDINPDEYIPFDTSIDLPQHMQNGDMMALDLPTGTEETEDPVRLVWMNLVHSLPIHLQPEALNLLDEFEDDVQTVVSLVESPPEDIPRTRAGSRLADIIEQVKNGADVETVLDEEPGDNIYRMARLQEE